jgi:hypothetical protein
MSYVILGDDSLSLYTSTAVTVVDLTPSNNLTEISILSSSANFQIYDEPVETFSSLVGIEVIDLTKDLENLLSIIILNQTNIANYNLGTSFSVLLALRVFITIDFASRTSFNSSTLLDFEPPQFWIGA